MAVIRPEAFGKEERLTAQVQAKVTPSEYAELVAIRDELLDLGVADVSISSVTRTFLVAGIRAYRDGDQSNQTEKATSVR